MPAKLELIPIPGLPGQSAAAWFAKYRECDLGPYMEVIVSIPVIHSGRVYGYLAVIYVDTDTALLASRELGGYPKKLAQVTMRNYGDLFLSHMARGSRQQKTDANVSDGASANVTKGAPLVAVPLPADAAPELAAAYNLLLPVPPATDRPQDYTLCTVGLRRVPGVGPGPDGADVLQLPSTWYSGAYILRGDMHATATEWVLVEDLKNSS